MLARALYHMQVLNNFLDGNFEELKLELHREDSRPSQEQTEAVEQEAKCQKNEAKRWERGRAEQENNGDLEEENGRETQAGFEDREFSQRVHELYLEFVRVVTANLEGTTAILRTQAHKTEES